MSAADHLNEGWLRHLYAYDRTLPLLATTEREAVLDGATREPVPGLRRERVTFTSTHDQRVLATITLPDTEGPFPAIIVQHGSTSLGRHTYATATPAIALPLAYRWALEGCAIVSVDAYGFGSREAADNRGRLAPDRPDLMFRTRDQRIQSVQDLMRTVDYLLTRDDIRSDAIGYHGVSMGTRVGVPFIALDPRVRAASLFVGGSGPYSRYEVEGTDFAGLAEDEERVFTLTDPISFAPFTSHVAKFVANGRTDTTVGLEAAELLQATLAEPKELHWFDGGHGDAPPELIETARRFLVSHLA